VLSTAHHISPVQTIALDFLRRATAQHKNPTALLPFTHLLRRATAQHKKQTSLLPFTRLSYTEHKKQTGMDFIVHIHVVSMEKSVELTASPSSAFPPRFECPECGKPFSTKNNCQRHRRSIHEPHSSSPFIEKLPTSTQGNRRSANLIPVLWKKQKLDCPHATCKRKGENGISRHDNLIQHRRSVHNEIIPKRERES